MTTTDTLTVREGEGTVVVDLREGLEIGLHELAMVRHWLATIRMSRAVRPQTYKRYAERLEEWLPMPYSRRPSRQEGTIMKNDFAMVVRQGELLHSLKSLLASTMDAISSDPHKDWKESLADGADMARAVIAEAIDDELVLADIMEELDAWREESELTWCYNCKGFVKAALAVDIPGSRPCRHDQQCPDCEECL